MADRKQLHVVGGESMKGHPLKSGDGDGTFDDMGQRLARLETRVDGIDQRLDRIERAIERIADNALTKWDVAQVVFVVTAALMAAAVFGPRVLSMMAAP